MHSEQRSNRILSTAGRAARTRRRCSVPLVALLVAMLHGAPGAEATTPVALVKDINPGPSSSAAGPFTEVNGTVFFSAGSSAGLELWKSDGTPDGTVMVKDIWMGLGNSLPDELTAVGATLFFTANDGINGKELWKSDGTTAGTVMVKDVGMGSDYGGPRPSNPTELTAVGDTLYFVASDSTGKELWRSDGTAEGTQLIDLGTGPSSPTALANINGTLYLSAIDGVNGREPSGRPPEALSC